METVNEIDKYFRVFKIKKPKKIGLKELKRRYRVLLRKYHPDKGGSHNATVLINSAYSYLKIIAKQNEDEDNKKFYNDNFIFYGNGSIYDIKKKRWVKIIK